MTVDVKQIGQKVEAESAFVEKLLGQLRLRLVGQDHLVRALVGGLLSNGHILLEGVPGLAWKNRAKPHLATPVFYRGGLYVGRDNGILTRYEIDTGKRTQRIRVGEGSTFTSSPVAADGHLYWASGEGDVFVIRVDGSTPQVVARNTVGETIIATPALTSEMILVRGRDHLFAFSQDAGRTSEGR